MTATAVSLDDKYDLETGVALVAGPQAMVRLLLEQARRDRAAGLNTGGYVTGYRGSPLGGVDGAFLAAKGHLTEAGVVFDPGLNEDLAATAILGTQQLAAFGPAKVDGVFALWYGKGPGVDRSGDAFKHGNLAGSSPKGGVLLAFGDDHPGKSSTTAHQSDHAIAANQIPILYPENVQEIISLGLFGYALSRYSGLWVGMKLVNETAEATTTIEVSGGPGAWRLPNDAVLPPEGVHVTGAFAPARDAEIVGRYRLPLAQAFARANGIDRITVDAETAGLCIVTAGKTHGDVRRALKLLGNPAVRVLKVAMTWPMEPTAVTAAAEGCAEVFVVEEKRAFMEDQVARILMNQPGRPRLTGKADETGAPLLPSDGQLDPRMIAVAIGERLVNLGQGGEALAARLAMLKGPAHVEFAADTPARTPYFCSGCPHNSSTRTPDGALAMSGIGCHSMAIWMDRDTLPPVQMGAEGTNWIGASRFSERHHMFQNLGDGTYSHSGLLAIRAAVVAKVNLTYKILFNDAVAMTGGQTVEGELTVDKVARQVLAAGVARCVVVSEDPQRLGAMPGVAVHGREDFDAVQRELAATPGVTVLIFDQVCAAEKRRRRKRGTMVEPDTRLFINTAVCEGCGDCTVKSNCVSVLPKETPLGRKREIDQSNCNKDYSCLNGFCPAFVSVKVVGGQPKARPDLSALQAEPPEPVRRPLDGPFAVAVTGIGGTGVITIGSVLAMAAHVEGKAAACYNMTGLAQKGGAVMSHLKIAPTPADLDTVKIGEGEADLILGCDLVVAGGPEAVGMIEAGRTVAVVNSRAQPTAAFQLDRDFTLRTDLLLHNVGAAVGSPEALRCVDAAEAALAAFGDALASNLFLVGFAFQQGLLPLGSEAIETAIKLNGVSQGTNQAAFRLGRLAAHDPARLEAWLAARRPAAEPGPRTLDEIIAHREALLTAYQDARYAACYRHAVDWVRAEETKAVPGEEAITRAVATGLAKLMAYKDEYEVARLHADPGFGRELAAAFGSAAQPTYHLAPPFMGATKRAFGPWMGPVFKVLARLKGLRGTPFDVFGYTAERRIERGLFRDYEATVGKAMAVLTPGNHAAVAKLLSYPQDIRGYGHVKAASIEAAHRERDRQLAALADPTPRLAVVRRVASTSAA